MQLSCIIITIIVRKNDIQKQMKIGGHRESKTRNELIKILKSSRVPLSATDLLIYLRKISPTVNKTTVYRELEKLEFHQIVTRINFNSSKAMFELTNSHHHHVVCVNCNKVEDVKIKEPKVFQLSKSSFKIMRHSLEFFGVCKTCQ